MFNVIKRVDKTRAWIILTVTILALGTLLNPIKTGRTSPMNPSSGTSWVLLKSS